MSTCDCERWVPQAPSRGLDDPFVGHAEYTVTRRGTDGARWCRFVTARCDTCGQHWTSMADDQDRGPAELSVIKGKYRPG